MTAERLAGVDRPRRINEVVGRDRRRRARLEGRAAGRQQRPWEAASAAGHRRQAQARGDIGEASRQAFLESERRVDPDQLG